MSTNYEMWCLQYNEENNAKLTGWKFLCTNLCSNALFPVRLSPTTTTVHLVSLAIFLLVIFISIVSSVNSLDQNFINYWWTILWAVIHCVPLLAFLTTLIFGLFIVIYCCHIVQNLTQFWGKSNRHETMFPRSSVLGNWRLSACKFETSTTPVLLSAFFSKLLEGLQWVKRQLAPKRKFYCSRRSPVDL